MSRPLRRAACRFAATAVLLALSFASEGAPPRVEVRFVTDEPEAVLAILDKKAAGEAPADADWTRLFSSEGYVRLKKREEGMGRPFPEADFRSFVLSDDLAKRRAALRETLRAWVSADPGDAGRRALAYLPADARIRATIYPSIKPRENSFVFEVDTNPAIFLYLDPAVSKEKLANTLAHELHHIGYGTACPPKGVEAEIEKLPKPTRTVLTWIGAFGEGAAMLAAAGGPDVHPHAASDAAERARWDRDVANASKDLKEVEAFFLDVLDGRLDEKATREKAFSFFGVQGPWYTVGWKMCVTIEKALGRERLLAAFCDPRAFLSTYQEAAEKADAAETVEAANGAGGGKPTRAARPRWSPRLLKALGGG